MPTYENQDEAKAVRSRKEAASATDPLGPGTAGYTTSGAAYRGMEVAADTGAPSPADPGFPVTRVGLHPGQGVGGDTTTSQAHGDLSGQPLNDAARAGRDGRKRSEMTAVEMLTSPVEGETPETRG
jgi:hypothetical protein